MTNDAFLQDRCNELDAELERTREELSVTRAERDDALQLARDLEAKLSEYHLLASEISLKREQELERLRAELRRLTMDVDAPAPWQTWAALIAFNALLWASLVAVGWVAWRLIKWW